MKYRLYRIIISTNFFREINIENVLNAAYAKYILFKMTISPRDFIHGIDIYALSLTQPSTFKIRFSRKYKNIKSQYSGFEYDIDFQDSTAKYINCGGGIFPEYEEIDNRIKDDLVNFLRNKGWL